MMTQTQQIEELKAALLTVQALNDGFYAVKNIRAWAAEENKVTKQAIRVTITAALNVVERVSA